MDFGTKRLLQGVGIGVVAVVAAPFIVPIGAAILRPLVKALIKQGFLGLESGRVQIARALEGLEDIVAEVRAEVENELSQREPGQQELRAEPSVERTESRAEVVGSA